MDALADFASQFTSPLHRALTGGVHDVPDRYDARVLMALFLVGVISWFGMEALMSFLLLKREHQISKPYTSEERRQLASQGTGFIHAVVVTTGALYLLFSPGSQHVGSASCGRPTCDTSLYGPVAGSELLFVFMSSYFFYDIIICLSDFSNWGAGFLIHASLCWALYWLPLGLFPFCQYYGLYFALFEGSTPLLSVRAFMMVEKQTDSAAYKIVNWAFCGMFILFRFVMGWSVSWTWWMRSLQAWNNGEAHNKGVYLLYFGSNVLLHLLNVGWFSANVVPSLLRMDAAKDKEL